MPLKLNTIILGIALLGATAAPSLAQEGGVLALLSQCRADAAELCGDVRPGQGRIAACLYSQTGQLRPGCRKAVRVGVAMKACAWDAKQFCDGVMPGEGRIAACLWAVRERLSPDCRAVAGAWSGSRDYGDEHQDRDLLK